MAEETKQMPIGSPMSLPIRQEHVQTTEGNEKAPVLTEDAVATLVWYDYERARAYIESDNTAWLLEWQETDILYQSPIPYRFERVQNGQPARVPRFTVAKATRTMARGVKRAVFAEQYPFFLRPGDNSNQENVNAWTYLIGVYLDRARFRYYGGLQIDGQTLFGTGIGKYGLMQTTRVKKTRKRKTQDAKVEMPISGEKTIPHQESDDFKMVETTVTETLPFYEYRKLGTTLFDPKWCTPNQPGESAAFCIDYDYPTFYDLDELRKLSCYQEKKDKDGNIVNPGIPSREALLNYFFQKQEGSAPMGTQTEDTMSAQGSVVEHAAARNRSTSVDPLLQPLLLISRWDERTVKEILVYDGRKLTIRNEEHDCDSMCHTACIWWPIENSGYGMGIGRLVGPDQRVDQGTLNAALKLLAFPMNAPILYAAGSENAPTQNTILRLGGYQAVDPGPSGDVRKAMAFMEMPAIPADAWRMIEMMRADSQDLSGADSQLQRGIPNGRQGIGRSSFGAQRLATMSDEEIADPVDAFAEGVIVPFVKFIIHMVKTKIPIPELRKILNSKKAKEIIKSIDMDSFLGEEFEVTVLAGQKLAIRKAIQQLLPFFLQIVQQPQLMQFLHERGETVDFKVVMDLLMQASELAQQPDIFRALTADEKKMVQQMNAGVQRIQQAVVQERAKGQARDQNIRTQGEVDLGNKAAEIALQHTADGIPLEHAIGLTERAEDVAALRQGLPDIVGESA